MKALAVSLLGWVLVPALALAQPAADLNSITNVRVNGGTVEISGSKKPNFTTFTMTDPPRLVIDIAEATFSGVPEEQQVGNGVVTGIRTASYGSDSSAIARVLIGYEREVETDIQASGNNLVVKVTGGNAVAAAEKPAAAAEKPAAVAESAQTGAPANSPAGVSAADATRAANEERQRQEQAAAAAAESARAERAAQEKAAAEATARAQADAEAERKRQDESRAAAQRQEEETRAAAQAAAEERKRQEADARASAQAAAEERKRQDADARAAAQKTAEEERRAAAQAAADEKRQKVEEARAEAEARKQAQAEAREAAADEKRQKAEEARAERERRQQEAVAAAETRSRPSQGSRAAESRHEAASSSQGVSEVSSRRKTMTLVGFQQQQGASRVFVRTNEPVRYTVSEQDKQVVLELENTRVEFTNNTRPLDTHFFATAVAKVEADPGANRTVRVTIQLKESARFETRQDGNLITLDFQRPAR
ncbi:AMIN domain-containing protein [Myxococcaceae bacterium JPH2]|nr:AMIN domain-containing protein [Myxococcaceae bacterium JPH2]